MYTCTCRPVISHPEGDRKLRGGDGTRKCESSAQAKVKQSKRVGTSAGKGTATIRVTACLRGERMSGLASQAQLRASVLRWSLFTVPACVLLGRLSATVAGSGPGNPWFDALERPGEVHPQENAQETHR